MPETAQAQPTGNPTEPQQATGTQFSPLEMDPGFVRNVLARSDVEPLQTLADQHILPAMAKTSSKKLVKIHMMEGDFGTEYPSFDPSYSGPGVSVEAVQYPDESYEDVVKRVDRIRRARQAAATKAGAHGLANNFGLGVPDILSKRFRNWGERNQSLASPEHMKWYKTGGFGGVVGNVASYAVPLGPGRLAFSAGSKAFAFGFRKGLQYSPRLARAAARAKGVGRAFASGRNAAHVGLQGAMQGAIGTAASFGTRQGIEKAFFWLGGTFGKAAYGRANPALVKSAYEKVVRAGGQMMPDGQVFLPNLKGKAFEEAKAALSALRNSIDSSRRIRIVKAFTDAGAAGARVLPAGAAGGAVAGAAPMIMGSQFAPQEERGFYGSLIGEQALRGAGYGAVFAPAFSAGHSLLKSMTNWSRYGLYDNVPGKPPPVSRVLGDKLLKEGKGLEDWWNTSTDPNSPTNRMGFTPGPPPGSSRAAGVGNPGPVGPITKDLVKYGASIPRPRWMLPKFSGQGMERPHDVIPGPWSK